MLLICNGKRFLRSFPNVRKEQDNTFFPVSAFCMNFLLKKNNYKVIITRPDVVIIVPGNNQTEFEGTTAQR